MKELHLFYAPDLSATHELPKDEAVHACRVLRMQEGDELMATDGCGHLFTTSITEASQKRCRVKIEEVEDVVQDWKGQISLAIAPTKNMDRIEWMAEKATEIGLNELTLLHCERSERRVVKSERVDKILVAATKQSHKCWKPQLNELIGFKKFVAEERAGQKFIAHCYADEDVSVEAVELYGQVKAEEDTLVLVGPEGDFSIEEVEYAIAHGFLPIRLGKSRLRTETAGVVAVHTMYLAKC